MDYYSVLGSIDPQYPDPRSKQLLPGVGYLIKSRELVKQTNESNATPKAELTFLIKKFNPAQLFGIEQTIKIGISLASEWLRKYKFKDWKKTESGKKSIVT